MSNESTTPGPAEARPSLPQFDPNAPARPAADDTQTLPAATTSALPVTPPATPYAYAASPAGAPIAGPSVPLSPTGLAPRVSSGPTWGERLRSAFHGGPTPGDGSRWSAQKTAVTAGLAIVLASAGAIGAAAAMPAGSTGGDVFQRGPGGRTFQFPGGPNGQQNQQLPNQQLPNQQGQNGQQLPNLQNGVPGGGLGGIDPNQLSQLDPQDLLRQLNQGVDPFSDGSDDSGSTSGTTTTKTT